MTSRLLAVTWKIMMWLSCLQVPGTRSHHCFNPVGHQLKLFRISADTDGKNGHIGHRTSNSSIHKQWSVHSWEICGCSLWSCLAYRHYCGKRWRKQGCTCQFREGYCKTWLLPAAKKEGRMLAATRAHPVHHVSTHPQQLGDSMLLIRTLWQRHVLFQQFADRHHSCFCMELDPKFLTEQHVIRNTRSHNFYSIKFSRKYYLPRSPVSSGWVGMRWPQWEGDSLEGHQIYD